MAQGQLCYPYDESNKLLFSISDDTKLVYKGGGSSSIGKVHIEIINRPDHWICKTYDCRHEIETKVVWSFSGSTSTSIYIDPIPNFTGTFTVSTHTHCESPERPITTRNIIATQKKADSIRISAEVVADGKSKTYRITLDNTGKLSTLEPV